MKRANGLPPTAARLGFGHMPADCSWQPPVPSGWISVPWSHAFVPRRIIAAVSELATLAWSGCPSKPACV